MPFSNGFWSMFWIGLIFIPLLCVWMCSIFDVFMREMSGWAKAFWLLAIIFLPVVGTCIYLIVRPGKSANYGYYGNWSLVYPGDYNQPVVPERDEVGPIHVVASPASQPVDELQMLNQLHDAGKLTDAEYASATARYATTAAAPGKDSSAAA